MKIFVKMKSTQKGKDDDTHLTVTYNKYGEYRIGPDLLKAFKDMGVVDVIPDKKGKKEKTPKDQKENGEKPTDDEGADTSPTVKEAEAELEKVKEVEAELEKMKPTKKNKKK